MNQIRSECNGECAKSLAELPRVTCRRFLTTGVRPGDLILDVGSGDGDLMFELQRMGANPIGVEMQPNLVTLCQQKGLDVRLGIAEQLPLDDGEFKRVVCSVVIPYTDERKAIAELSRVLQPGGTALVTYHGLGYGLAYLLRGLGYKRRFYGMRMIVNTLFYRLTGRCLPSFVGDTLCQLMSSLNSYYHCSGLFLERQVVAESFLGFPVFFCHELTKLPSANENAPR